MKNLFDYIMLGSTVLLCILILIQTRGASIGAGFGAGAEINTVRRGAEKTLHQITIITVLIFCGSLILRIFA